MAQLRWGNGRGIGLNFISNEEYYETLGYLSQNPRKVTIFTHKNDESGAWAGQGKLRTQISKNLLPAGLKRSFDLSGDNRLSVTDYVRNLVNNHEFTSHFDPTGNRYTYYRFPKDYQDVRNTVPREYLPDFDRGYQL